MMQLIRQYIDDLKGTLDLLPLERIDNAIQLLRTARMERRQVFIMGNGGSASTASHFVCDLAKNTKSPHLPHFKVIGLTDNVASFSAYANDDGYASVFAMQMEALVQPNDIVIGISTSGNSPNVLEAIKLANRVGATTIGFTGFDGGQLSELVDLDLHVPSESIEQVEDIHLMLEHLIVSVIKKENEAAAEIPPLQLANM